ncbi:MAG: glycosyltransferase family 4 protein [Candidatus Paceibacterota bacterium]
MTNKKRKVIIFSTAYLPFVGGAEVAVKEITDRLENYADDEQNKFDFTMVTARLKKELLSFERVGNIDVYRVGIGSFWDKYLLPFLGVFKALRIKGADNEEKPIIWAIMASFGGFGALFLKLLRPKWPFILTLQEGDSEKHILKKVGIFYPVWKMIFKRADYVQAISEYLKYFAVKYGAKCPIEVVPNGVDFNKFQKAIRQSAEQINPEFQIQDKEKIGIKDNEKIILTVSRLVEKNGIDILIRAINEFKVKSYKVHKVRLLIAGEGKEIKKLERLANKLGLENEIIFAGEIKLEEIVEYYKIADVFARPSRTEGFGNVFIEAMAAGTPVVATYVGGIKDFLKDGENGLACKVDDPKDLAEKINRILEDENLRRKLIEGGLKTAKKYDWENIAKRMGGILNEATCQINLTRQDN